MASIAILRRAAARARWAHAAQFSSGIVSEGKPILVRDFLRSALYDPNHGYFFKRSGPVGVLSLFFSCFQESYGLAPMAHDLAGRPAYLYLRRCTCWESD